MSAEAALTQDAAPAESSRCDWPAITAELLSRLRRESTRVHAITNAAAQVLTANLILAAGGTPSLTIAPEEITAFTSRADALLVNLGTLDGDRRAAIPWGIAAAKAQGKPWVLDPVFVDASPPRLELARLCLAGTPCVLRCNRAEFAALAGEPAVPDCLTRYATRRLHRRAHRPDGLGHGRRTLRRDRERPPADGPGHRHGLRRDGACRGVFGDRARRLRRRRRGAPCRRRRGRGRG